MPTRTTAGILGMDTMSLCSVIRDFHRRLEFQSDLFLKNQADERSAKGGNHSERTPSQPCSADVEHIDLTTNLAVCVIVCDHFQLLSFDPDEQ